MKKYFLSISVVCMLLAVLATEPVLAQSNIPQMINYQGYLTEADGKPVSPDTYALSFSIYATKDTTTPLWGPKDMPDVPVVEGHFNVILGPEDTAGKNIALAFTSPEAFLEITFKDNKIAPRQQILSTPYAMNGVPAGTIVAYGGGMPAPQGWLFCDGTLCSKSDYPGLYAAIGTAWGGTDTHFNVPDLRGRFLRGVDHNMNRDLDRATRTESSSGGNAGDTVGSLQGYATAQPSNAFGTNSTGVHDHVTHSKGKITGQLSGYLSNDNNRYSAGGGADKLGLKTDGPDADFRTGDANPHSHTISSGGDKETRPVNANVEFIIKY